MDESILDSLTVLNLPDEVLGQLGISVGPLVLKKSWPRAADHLGLEYVSIDGSRVPGQWFDNPNRYRKVARETSRATTGTQAHVAKIADRGLLLQAKGADRKLRGLGSLLNQPGSSILTHRPERRAVVKLESNQDRRYAKVVRTKQVEKLAKHGQKMKQLSNGFFCVPTLLKWNLESGVLIWSDLPGVSLNELLRDDSRDRESRERLESSGAKSAREASLLGVFESTGRALHALHNGPVNGDLPAHGYEDEIKVLHKWVNSLQIYRPGLYALINAHLANVYARLEESGTTPVLLHRDFYGKQVIAAKNGKIGFLDFDTLSVGEAAIDLANMLAHIELRWIQKRCPKELAQKAGSAILDGYKPDGGVRLRLHAYADASRLRLACVYSTRPQESVTVRRLLERMGMPIIGLNQNAVDQSARFIR